MSHSQVTGITRLLFIAILLVTAAISQAQPLLFFGFRGGPALPEFRAAPAGTLTAGSSSGRSLALFMRYGRKTYWDFSANWARASRSLDFNFGQKGRLSEDVSFNQFGLAARWGCRLINRPGFHWRMQTGPQLGRTTVAASQSLGAGNTLRENGWIWQLGTGIDLFHFNIDLGYNIGMGRLDSPVLAGGVRLNMWALEVGVHL